MTTAADLVTALTGSPATIASGQATCATTSLTVGSHSLTANYSGDANYATSTNTVTQTVKVALFENTAPAVQFSGWLGGAATTASGGAYRMSKLTNDTLTYRFTGTSITWVTRTWPDQGKAQVLIDGVSKGVFDLYSPGNVWNVRKPFSRLTNTAHTLVLKVTGTKNGSSKGNNVTFDAFIVGARTIEENSLAILFKTWTGVAQPLASGGSYRSAATAGSVVSLTFTGTGINWITAMGPSYGKATVWIDGKSKGTVDLYYKTQKWRVVKAFTGLSDGKHTIQIRVLGTRNLASTGTAVVVDAFSGAITVPSTAAEVRAEPEVQE